MMRKLILAVVAAAIAGAPLATVVKAADDTTVIQKDDTMGDHKAIIKKHENRPGAPREGKKMMMHRDQNY
jgi:Ni/Co efflux regulator RcnB